jgi:hypothetical protein
MADKHDAAPAPTVSPNEFTSVFAELIKATTRKHVSVAKMRGIRAQLEKAGTNMRALDFVIKLRRLEADEAAILLRDIFRYAGFLGMDAVKQGDMFAASDDVAMPNETQRGELAEAVAYEEGYRAGKAGRDAGDTRFPAGSPLHQRHYEGWVDGQAAIVGVKKGKGSVKAVAPAAGRRKSRSARAGAI